VREAPGAHVILKSQGGTPSDEDIAFAARIALRFSKLAKDGKGDVLFTEKKYVKRPKRGPKGLVLVSKEKTISVKIEES
jgi:predicted ribosome quality control (RQC) complex YloA/Tae2 family protein